MSKSKQKNATPEPQENNQSGQGHVEMPNELVIPTSAPLTLSNEMPSYLAGTERTGLETFEKSDYRIPEIKLLQGLNPELLAYPEIARLGEYFHTGMLKSLGAQFRSIICVARKRVILWRPKNDNGGGILAMSQDSVNWNMGANKEFSVTLKGAKKPVIWKTGPNVKASGLTEFGSANPEDDNSPPAAIQYYEYVHYLPDFENGSPVVQRLKSTALDSARRLNTYFLLQKKPVYVHAIDWTVEAKSANGNNWTIPKFNPLGYVDKRTFEICKEMHAQYADIELHIEQEDDNNGAQVNTEAF